MVDICYPSGTDWSCAYTAQELADMRADPAVLAVMERSEALGWSTLSALTGYRVSLCPVVIRPCALGCMGGSYFAAPVVNTSGSWVPGSGWGPYMSGGNWYNGCGCGSVSDCSCSYVPQALLPTEIGKIESVWLNGAELDPSAYRVDNGTRLTRTDGEDWPMCQDMTIDDPADGGFFVTYYPGVAPNDLLRFAAGVLATEFFKACNGGKCRLPQGVTSVTRAGVSMEIPSGLFPGGATGIHEVDAVIRMYNPFALKAPARVMSPDSRRGRFQTGA